MRRRLLILALACAAGTSACVIPMHGPTPQPVNDQPDTFRFRIFPNAVALEATVADHAVGDEIEKFRVANDYASSEIVSRDYLNSSYIYTVRFAR